MQNYEKKEFKGLIEALAASFGVEADFALIEGYWLGLESISLVEINKAVRRAISECDRMPRPKDLRELAGEMPTSTRAAIAWGAVVKTISAHGSYESVDFDDKTINATIRNMGGWTMLCSKNSDELHTWSRKEFERIYSALSSSPIQAEAYAYLPGKIEEQNVGLGFEAPKPRQITTGLPANQKLLGQTQPTIQPQAQRLIAHASGQIRATLA